MSVFVEQKTKKHRYWKNLSEIRCSFRLTLLLPKDSEECLKLIAQCNNVLTIGFTKDWDDFVQGRNTILYLCDVIAFVF